MSHKINGKEEINNVINIKEKKLLNFILELNEAINGIIKENNQFETTFKEDGFTKKYLLVKIIKLKNP